jgi:hypothetical protein
MSFADAMSAAPPVDEAAATGTFKIKLSLNGVVQGYLGQNGGEWAVLADANGALSLEWYPYNSVNYIRRVGTSRYMSVGSVGVNNGYVGFYAWSGAGGWTLQGTRLKGLNGQAMSIYSKDNAYIYCWDEYTVLDVTLES